MASSTTREILDKALKRHRELMRELGALDQIIKTCEQLLHPSESSEITPDDEPGLFKAPSAKAAHAEYVAKMIDVARRVLLSEQRPMQRGELRSRVEAAGFEVVGKDKNKVFGTNIWRSKKFQMVEGKGYWPIDEALPR